MLDPDTLGLGLTVFVMLEAMEPTPEWRAAFLSTLATLDPVRDVYRLAGS
ncbi:hypothetical protein [Thioclava dalianensis]|nr:hypothetical protein [Thioclava dalianensis]